MPLNETLSDYWRTIQGQLFPWLEEELGPLGEKHKQLVAVLELARVEDFLHHWRGVVGRPLEDRAALARSFVAKATFNIPMTNMLIERLLVDKTLRRLCGWERLGAVPSESTFSRAFAEFAESALPSRLHEALIKRTHADRLVGHISRDSTAIEAREKPQLVAQSRSGGRSPVVAGTFRGTFRLRVAAPEEQKPKRGRPRKGEERPQAMRRLERQPDMSLREMLADLPRHCAIGAKRDAKGFKTSWTGYKLHLDVADGGVPVSCLLTSASLHDSQAAIPLATMTAARTINLSVGRRKLPDDLMDSAYDAPEIRDYGRSLGHVVIIDVNPRCVPGLKQELADEARRQKRAGYKLAEDVRYNERSTVERVNGRLKDDFGGRTVRVRGHDKVMCHLMFCILTLSVDALMRMVT